MLAMRDCEEQNRSLRIQREKFMYRKKCETEKRLRELQEIVQEKRSKREEHLNKLRIRKVCIFYFDY